MTITINKYDIVDDNPKEILEQYVIQNFDDFIELLFEVFNLNNTKNRQMLKFKLKIIKILEKFRKNFKIENIKPKMIQTLIYYDTSLKHLFKKNNLNSNSIYQLIKLQILIFINKIKNIKNIESLIDIFTDKITNIIPLITPDNIIGPGPGLGPGSGSGPGPGPGPGSGPGDQNPNLNSMTKAYKFFSSQLFPMLSKKTYVPYGFRNNNFKSIVDDSQIASLDKGKIEKILEFIKDSELLNLGNLKTDNFISSLTTVAKIIKDTSMSANTIETWITISDNKSAYNKDKQHILSFNNTISVFITYYIYDLIKTQENFDQKKKLLKYLLLIYKYNSEIIRNDKINIDINIEDLDEKNMNILLAYLLELIQEYLDTSILFYEILNFNKIDTYQAENFIINEFLVKPWTVYLASIKRIELDDIQELNMNKENNSFFTNDTDMIPIIDTNLIRIDLLLVDGNPYFDMLKKENLLNNESLQFNTIDDINDNIRYIILNLDLNSSYKIFSPILISIKISQYIQFNSDFLKDIIIYLKNLNHNIANNSDEFYLNNEEITTKNISPSQKILFKKWMNIILSYELKIKEAPSNTDITIFKLADINNIRDINLFIPIITILNKELATKYFNQITHANTKMDLLNQINQQLKDINNTETNKKLRLLITQEVKKYLTYFLVNNYQNNYKKLDINGKNDIDENFKQLSDLNTIILNITKLIKENQEMEKSTKDYLEHFIYLLKLINDFIFKNIQTAPGISYFTDKIVTYIHNIKNKKYNIELEIFKNYKKNYLSEMINKKEYTADVILKRYLKCFIILFTEEKFIFENIFDNYSINNNIKNDEILKIFKLIDKYKNNLTYLFSQPKLENFDRKYLIKNLVLLNNNKFLHK